MQHAEQIKLDNGDCNLMGRRWLSLECVSCFTLGPARTFYRREITEQSVMVVGLLPSPYWAFPPSTGPRWLPPAGSFSILRRGYSELSRSRSRALRELCLGIVSWASLVTGLSLLVPRSPGSRWGFLLPAVVGARSLGKPLKSGCQTGPPTGKPRHWARVAAGFRPRCHLKKDRGPPGNASGDPCVPLSKGPPRSCRARKKPRHPRAVT